MGLNEIFLIGGFIAVVILAIVGITKLVKRVK